MPQFGARSNLRYTNTRQTYITNWIGGLNTIDDPQSIRDNELVRANNFMIANDGSLQNRYGMHLLDNVCSISGSNRYRLLGKFGNTAIFSAEPKTGSLVTSTVYACDMKKFTPSNRVWPGLSANPVTSVYDTGVPVGTSTDGLIIKAMSYLNSLILIHEHGLIRSYLVSGSLVYPGSSLTGSIPLLPTSIGQKGIVIWKDRLFYAATDGKIYYSAATTLTDFSTPNGGYFTVGNDPSPTFENTPITQLLVVGDAMYIFKESSVYIFTFQVDPGTDGYLRVISPDTGAQRVVLWHNRVFAGSRLGVYEFSNGVFNKINIKMYTQSDFDCEDLYVYGNYLLASFSSGVIQCMNLYTGSWTVWSSSGISHVKNTINFDLNDSGIGGAHSMTLSDSGADYGLTYMSTLAPRYDTSTVGAAGVAGTKAAVFMEFITKMFTLDDPWTIKKIHKIFIDRGGRYDVSPAPSGGFQVYYYTADQLEHVVPTTTDNKFGLVVIGGSFRALMFKIRYYFTYPSTPADNFNLNINNLLIEASYGSKYTKSDGSFYP